MMEMTRFIAAARVEEVNLDVSSPVAILKSLSWDFENEFLIGGDGYSTESSVYLTQGSPLGKVARAIAAIEKYFPECKIEIGEIWKDGIVDELVKEVESMNEADADTVEKLMTFDESRLVVYVDGEPFDYLAEHFNRRANCIKVKKFSVWDYLDFLWKINWLIGKFYYDCDEQAFLAEMQRVMEIFPESCFAREVLRSAHFKQYGSDAEYVRLMKEEVRRKMSFFKLTILHSLTREDFWMKLLVDEYGYKMFDFWQSKLEKESNDFLLFLTD